MILGVPVVTYHYLLQIKHYIHATDLPKHERFSFHHPPLTPYKNGLSAPASGPLETRGHAVVVG